MNSYDIFRKLTRGMKFDHNRFKGDLKKIGVNKTNEVDKSTLTVNESKENEEEAIDEEPETTEEDLVEDDRVNEDEEGKVNMLSDIQIGGSEKTERKQKKKKKDSKEKQLRIHQQQVNHIRNKLGISVWGTDIPDPIETFDEMIEKHKLSDLLVSNLLNQGYSEPTSIQKQAWPLMMQGREILGCAPTGSGKTAAFLVPVLNQLGGPQRKGFRAVILAPTRELAKQTYRECTRLSEGLGLRVHIISNVNKAKEKFGPKSAKKFDVLVTTPNRLVFLLQEDDTPPIDLSNVEWLVVDESDRLFEGGARGFRDQLAAVYRACTGPNIRRALFSATFAHEVQHWCKLNLNNVAMVTVGIRNTACEDVKQELVFCGNETGKVLALREIFRKGYEPPVLVFVQTKERAKELFKELIYDNIMVDAIHADRTQLQRDNVVRAFRERKIWVLICTELMARGIDFKGVNLVINYDFPPSAISYIHRVGRTGRAQHQGKAVTFWTMEDKPYLRSIALVMHNSGQHVPEWMLELKKATKNEKKKLSTKHPERGHISQGVLYEKVNKRKLKQMKEKSKRMKMMNGKAAINGDDERSDHNMINNVDEQTKKKKTKKKKVVQ
ncbi:probable ATP-dependent RNA helicase DDX52 [Penaeus japonicus]|uniref:probable ATP-dependent RNA helicase DDX52 n=1 Tax=Penaeus japonicus TaxID=27405 RepID=UPI001C70B7A7|nr:probable ATP-dependent RNA helicase DDX52 [Penaeus japonicus]